MGGVGWDSEIFSLFALRRARHQTNPLRRRPTSGETERQMYQKSYPEMAKFVYQRCVKRRNKNIYMHPIPPSPLFRRFFFRPFSDQPTLRRSTTKTLPTHRRNFNTRRHRQLRPNDRPTTGLRVSGSAAGLLKTRHFHSFYRCLAWLAF